MSLKKIIPFKPTIISMFLLTSLLFTGCGESYVQTVRIESEANQIIDVLNENGIQARKEAVGEGDRKVFEIKVSGGEEVVRESIQLMEDHCLGKPEPPAIEGSAIVTSMPAEKAQAERRMKINIESQLRHLPGATCVEVNFVPPQDRTLAINPYPSTASVTINYKTPTFARSEEDIANLVARSVPDLKPENVSVILSAKPLRPLPENRAGYNFTRVALVSGIGCATLLMFFSIVFVLRKKRQNQFVEGDNEIEDGDEDERQEPGLIGERNFFDEDEDINLP